jgi:hypothetical protein
MCRLIILCCVRLCTSPYRSPWLGQVHGLSILSHNLHIDFRLSVTHLPSVSELRGPSQLLGACSCSIVLWECVHT